MLMLKGLLYQLEGILYHADMHGLELPMPLRLAMVEVRKGVEDQLERYGYEGDFSDHRELFDAQYNLQTFYLAAKVSSL